jgi:hypothetical protein
MHTSNDESLCLLHDVSWVLISSDIHRRFPFFLCVSHVDFGTATHCDTGLINTVDQWDPGGGHHELLWWHFQSQELVHGRPGGDWRQNIGLRDRMHASLSTSDRALECHIQMLCYICCSQ